MKIRAFFDRLIGKPSNAPTNKEAYEDIAFGKVFQAASQIRIGTTASDVDALAAQTDGMVTSMTLNGLTSRTSGGWNFGIPQPCTVVLDQNDRVSAINFPVEYSPVHELTKDMTVDNVRHLFPKHREM